MVTSAKEGSTERVKGQSLNMPWYTDWSSAAVGRPSFVEGTTDIFEQA
jgi:hypothetical protein